MDSKDALQLVTAARRAYLDSCSFQLRLSPKHLRDPQTWMDGELKELPLGVATHHRGNQMNLLILLYISGLNETSIINGARLSPLSKYLSLDSKNPSHNFEALWQIPGERASKRHWKKKRKKTKPTSALCGYIRRRFSCCLF